MNQKQNNIIPFIGKKTPDTIAQTSPTQEWQVGQKVKSPKFGYGMVLEVFEAKTGSIGLCLAINFSGIGIKQLALKYAVLEKC